MFMPGSKTSHGTDRESTEDSPRRSGKRMVGTAHRSLLLRRGHGETSKPAKRAHRRQRHDRPAIRRHAHPVQEHHAHTARAGTAGPEEGEISSSKPHDAGQPLWYAAQNTRGHFKRWVPGNERTEGPVFQVLGHHCAMAQAPSGWFCNALYCTSFSARYRANTCWQRLL